MHISHKSVDSFASWIHHEKAMKDVREKSTIIRIFHDQTTPLDEKKLSRDLTGHVSHSLIKKIVKAANRAFYHPEMNVFFEEMADGGSVGRHIENADAKKTLRHLFLKACSGPSLDLMFKQVDALKKEGKISGENAHHIKTLAARAHGSTQSSAPAAAAPAAAPAVAAAPAAPAPDKRHLATIYADTMKKAHEGYRNRRSEKIEPNRHSEELGIKEGTRLYGTTRPLPTPTRQFHTEFLHIKDDSINVALRLKREGKNPVVLNLANAFHPGGGVVHGSVAQEEDLFRRTNMYISLVPEYNSHLKDQVAAYKKTPEGRRMTESRPDGRSLDYLVPELGGIYSPNVSVFREDQRHGFAYMDAIETLPFIAVAAYNRKHAPKERAGNADFGPTNERQYETNMKEKIRATLRIAADHGHEDVVLGALGCGAFRNDPHKVSRYMGEVLHEPEFHNRFRTIAFAILPSKGPEDNFEIFRSERLLQTEGSSAPAAQ